MRRWPTNSASARLTVIGAGRRSPAAGDVLTIEWPVAERADPGAAVGATLNGSGGGVGADGRRRSPPVPGAWGPARTSWEIIASDAMITEIARQSRLKRNIPKSLHVVLDDVALARRVRSRVSAR